MQHEVLRSQLLELTRETYNFQGVCFDPDHIRLEGFYSDELSAFRARRNWKKALESNFLLDLARDFELKIQRINGVFNLRCDFLTACGRYAFWRLTNDQAPEAQYQIETAHIPECQARYDEFVSAPDMKRLESSPTILEPKSGPEGTTTYIQKLLKPLFEMVSKKPEE